MRAKMSPILTDIALGARDVAPLAVAAATYGLAFGLVATQAGLTLWQTTTMSFLVFGGSAQLVSLDQLTAGAGVIAAIMAGVALNMRVLLITASMRYALMGRNWWQVVAGVYLATDASVALMQSARERGTLSHYWYLTGGNFFLFLVWIAATYIGAVVSSGIPDPESWGLDFAITAAFVALLPRMWRGRVDILPWGIAAATVAVFMLIAPEQASWALVSGAVLGAIAAGVTAKNG